MSTRYNTGNPIESTDVRDMSDNAKNFDEFSNSMSDSFTDRLGRDRQTIEGLIRKTGFNPAPFDFATGGTLVSGDRNKAVFNPEPLGDNNWYAWQGALPKTISPNSTPAASGGLGENSWKPVTNSVLAPTVRESIRRSYAEAGYNVVGTFQAGFTIVNVNDIGIDEVTGKGYTGPAGFVAAGTNPVGGGFVDRSAETLRHKLALNTGAGMVATADGRTVQERFDSIPAEVDAAGTAAALISQHNNDAAAHPALSAFISSEADRAETAAEAAAATGKIYKSSAEGIADTGAGDYFWVVSSSNNSTIGLWQNTTGAQALFTGKYIANSRVVFSYSTSGVNSGNMALDIDTSSNTMTFNGRVFIGARTESVSGTLDFSGVATQSIIYVFYNVDTSSFVGLTAGEAGTLDWDSTEYIYLLSYRPTLRIVLDFSNPYTIDGINVDPVNDVGHAQLYCQSGEVAVDSVARTITFPSGARISAGRTSVTLPSEKVFDYSGVSLFTFYVVYNAQTKEFRSATGSDIPNLSRFDFVVGLFNRSFHAFYEGISRYTIDGKLPSSSSNAKTNYSLIFTSSSSLNFDFDNNKIVISANLWLAYDGTRLLIAPTEIPLDPARNKGFRTLLLVNPSTSQIVLKSSAAGYSAPKDHILIGAYQENDMLFFGLEHFSVNGEPFNSNVEKIKPVFGWSVNNKVDANVVDSFTPSDSVNLSNLTSSIVYSWFDALVSAYPEYVTKTLLGNDASGTLPIYQYRFNPKRSGTDGRLDTKIPKIMLMTQHDEGINFVYTYLLMREICNNWQNNEALESMRFGTEFVVIPVGNPWGLDNGNRKNSNLVDLNRNFPIGWVKLGTPSDTFYSGEFALSEAEAQHIYAAMVNEKPDIFFDAHSYGAWNNNGQSVWQPVLNDKTRVAAMSTAQKVYAQYKKEYEWLVDLDDLVYISDSTITGGGLASKSAESVGAVGGTIEVACNLKDEPSGLTGHNSIINFATDYLGTSILQALSVIISSK